MKEGDAFMLERSNSLKIAGPLTLAILLGVILLVVLIAADPWKFMAITRLLDVLIEAGFIQYHDAHPGFIAGVATPEHYYQSQEPINWGMVALAALVIVAYSCLKGLQFHVLARAYGSVGSLGQHLRAYFYGDGLDRFLPFNMGIIGATNALVGYGMPEDRAKSVVFLSRVATVFEVSAFAILGLILLEWTHWLSHIAYSAIALGVAWQLVSKAGYASVVPPPLEFFRKAGTEVAALARARPALVVGLALLSLVAFGTMDLGAWVAMAAFDTVVTLIHVEPLVLMMSLVSAYIAARLVPVTPGGIGQWELGFATLLVLGDTDISLPLLCIAVVVNLLRIATGLGLMALALRGASVPTSLSEVFRVFARGRDREFWQGVEHHAPVPGKVAGFTASTN